MRKMFKIAVDAYDGDRGSRFYVEPTLFNTINEADTHAHETIKPDQWVSGEYQIIECTLNEETFTYTETVIKQSRVERG